MDHEEDSISSLDGINFLTKLMVLHCSDQLRLVSIEPIGHCPDLRELYCSSCGLESIEGSANCLKLVHLDISWNRIPFLAYINVNRLKTLNARHNRLTNIYALTSRRLRFLYVDCNLLTTLDGIENCTQLRYLDCGYNKIRSIESLKELLWLKSIQCDSNQLESLAGLEYHPNLWRLTCRRNCIQNLDDLVGCLRLRFIYVSDNKLTTLEGTNTLNGLHLIDCSQNLLTSLQGLPTGYNLQYIDADSNQIETFEGFAGNDKLSLSVRLNRIDIRVCKVYPITKHLYTDQELVSSIGTVD